MSCRRYGSKPTIAFWMLVAIADCAMVVATAGPAVLISVLVVLALLAGCVVTARSLTRARPVARRSSRLG